MSTSNVNEYNPYSATQATVAAPAKPLSRTRFLAIPIMLFVISTTVPPLLRIIQFARTGVLPVIPCLALLLSFALTLIGGALLLFGIRIAKKILWVASAISGASLLYFFPVGYHEATWIFYVMIVPPLTMMAASLTLSGLSGLGKLTRGRLTSI